MHIEPIALLRDNYAYLLRAADGQDCALLDPSAGPPLQALLQARGLQLTALFATHHHPDHVGGMRHLLAPHVPVYCSRYDLAQGRVPGATHSLDDGAQLHVLAQQVQVIHVPGHTQGALAYYMPQAAALFTGDTLFLAGCGRLFEGNAAQMYGSLRRLARLPPPTRIFCGHEYTEKNLRFAASVEPENPAVLQRLAAVQTSRQAELPTVPATLAEELRTNPFLRVDEPALQRRLGVDSGLAALRLLRARRDDF